MARSDLYEVRFFVPGLPSPAGSKRAFPMLRDKAIPVRLLEELADLEERAVSDWHIRAAVDKEISAAERGQERERLLSRWLKEIPLGVRVTDDNPRLKDWQAEVKKAARYHLRAQLPSPAFTGPVRLELTFYRDRPASHYVGGKKSNAVKPAFEWARPVVRPDVLKLARGVEDALTGLLYEDDAQVVDEVLSKVFCGPAETRTGVQVRAFSLTKQEACGNAQKSLL